jgi:phage terminase large subunit-like protein
VSDDALAVLAGLVVDDDGRRWGDVALPAQRRDARAVLADRRRQSYLTRPRGGSKTTDVAGMVVAALLEQLPPRSRSYGAAVDRGQAALLLDAIGGLVARSGVGVLRVGAGRVEHVNTGASFDVLAADAAGNFGLLPHLLVVDEIAQWPTTSEARRLWAALFSSLPKVKTSRFVAMTSAGDPSHPAGKLIDRARTSPRWYVSEWPGPTPWVSADDLEEQRAELPAWEFARLHLNRWTAPADRLVRPEDLAACVDNEPRPRGPEPGRRYVVALDVGLVKDRSVAAVCHAERRDGTATVVLDAMEVWQGSRRQPVSLSTVEEWVLAASRTYGGAALHFDPFQAEQLAERLRARRVHTERTLFTPTESSRRALLLHQLVRSHALALPDDAALLDELAHVRLKETSPGVYRLDHAADRHDDRAVALSMAAWALVGEGLGGPVSLAHAGRARLPRAGLGARTARGRRFGE